MSRRCGSVGAPPISPSSQPPESDQVNEGSEHRSRIGWARQRHRAHHREPAAHFEPYGWHHWPESPWFSYQLRRGLGETQEGGGAVSEVFQAASRIDPTSEESWHVEWQCIADRNFARAEAEEAAGHIRTAMNCYMRAADYYRQAEFFCSRTIRAVCRHSRKMEAVQPRFPAPAEPAGEDPGNPL